MDEESHLGEKLIETIMSVLKGRTNSSGEQRRKSIQGAALRGVRRKAGERVCLFEKGNGQDQEDLLEDDRVGSIPGRLLGWEGLWEEGRWGGLWEDGGMGSLGGWCGKDRSIPGRVLGWGDSVGGGWSREGT